MEPGNYICDGPRQLHFLCFQMIKGFCSQLWQRVGVQLWYGWLSEIKSQCCVISPKILDDTKYACTISLILSPKEFWYVHSRDAIPALTNPLCKWKRSKIVGPCVNFHFLSLQIPTRTFFLLILFNTSSFPWGERLAVSAAGTQKQRRTWREIQGLSIYGRVTLYCSKCIRD